jgi:hypothetical protein
MRLSGKNMGKLVWAVLIVILVTLSVQAEEWDGHSALNVRHFGAKGDGVTDDTAALQRAINTMKSIHARILLARQPMLEGHPNLGDLPVIGSTSENVLVPELFIPAGDYRLSRTLVAPGYCFIRGESGTRLIQTEPDKDILYIYWGFRVQVSGLEFIAGRRQLVVFTGNEDTSMIAVENCRFKDSVEMAFWSHNFRNPVGRDHSTRTIGPYQVDWTDPERPQLQPNDETLPWFNNSTLFTFENCFFENCHQVLHLNADGLSMRDCEIRAGRQGSSSAIRFSGLGIFRNIKAWAPADSSMDAWFEYDKYNLVIEHSQFSGKALPLVMITGKKRTEIPPSLVIRDSQAICDRALVDIRNSEEENFPVWTDICRVRNLAPTAAQIFHLQRIRSFEEMQNSLFDYGPAVKVTGGRHASEYRFGIILEDNYGLTSDNLPDFLQSMITPSFSKEQEKAAIVPSLRLPACVPSKNETLLRAVDFGVDKDPASDDTKAMQAMLQAAMAAPGPVCLELPPVLISLKETLDIPTEVRVMSPGLATLRQFDTTKTVFRGRKVRSFSVANLRFVGGRHAVELHTEPDIDATILFDKCFFYSTQSYAISVLSGDGQAGLPNRTQLHLRRSASIYATNTLHTNAKHSEIEALWLSTSGSQDLSPAICNAGGDMRVTCLLGVPVTLRDHRPNFLPVVKNWPYANDVRWFDNYGRLYLLLTRFGGEYRGIPAVYSFTAGSSLYMDTSTTCFFGETTRLCLLYFKETPALTMLRNCGWGYVHGKEGRTVKYADWVKPVTIYTRNFFYENDSFKVGK